MLRLPGHHDEPGNPLTQAGTHVGDAIDSGADCLVTPCPLCHLNLDLQQPEAAKMVGRDLGLAVLHLPQLIGLALGFEPKQLGMNQLHRLDKLWPTGSRGGLVPYPIGGVTPAPCWGILAADDLDRCRGDGRFDTAAEALRMHGRGRRFEAEVVLLERVRRDAPATPPATARTSGPTARPAGCASLSRAEEDLRKEGLEARTMVGEGETPARSWCGSPRSATPTSWSSAE